jgi:hypothetical protein
MRVGSIFSIGPLGSRGLLAQTTPLPRCRSVGAQLRFHGGSATPVPFAAKSPPPPLPARQAAPAVLAHGCSALCLCGPGPVLGLRRYASSTVRTPSPVHWRHRVVASPSHMHLLGKLQSNGESKAAGLLAHLLLEHRAIPYHSRTHLPRKCCATVTAPARGRVHTAAGASPLGARLPRRAAAPRRELSGKLRVDRQPARRRHHAPPPTSATS